MILGRGTLLVLSALLIAAAAFHSPWWLLALAGLAAWAAFDRWATGGPPGRYVSPESGREMAEIDLARARVPSHAASTFMEAVIQGQRGAALGVHADLHRLLAGCADLQKGLPTLDPRKAAAFGNLSCLCATCGQRFDKDHARRFLAAATGLAPPLPDGEGLPAPDDKGRCPNCGGERLRYVYDP